jgi:hypothetical protein
MSHLRALLFNAKGDRLPPLLRSHKVSTALLPVMKLPGMLCYAGAVVNAPEARRDAAVKVLVQAQKAKTPRIYGVALISCPSRNPSGKLYTASFAVLSPVNNAIWCGTAERATLGAIEGYLGLCVRYVRQGLETRTDMKPIAL